MGFIVKRAGLSGSAQADLDAAMLLRDSVPAGSGEVSRAVAARRGRLMLMLALGLPAAGLAGLGGTALLGGGLGGLGGAGDLARRLLGRAGLGGPG